MTTLSSILKPLKANEFFEDYWGNRVLHQHGSPEKFETVLTLDVFERGLKTYAPFLSYPRVTMYSEGHVLHESRFTVGSSFRISGGFGYREESLIDLGKITTILKEGATLKVSQAERVFPQLDALASQLATDLDERVHVNVYYTSGGTSAFLPHFDKHDVIILQVAGCKRWQIFDHRESFPLPEVRKKRNDGYRSSVVTEVDLTSGDLLYLPRGQWHHAEAVEGDSLHVTIGIHCATSIELLGWVATQLLNDEELRRNLPAGETLPDDLREYLMRAISGVLESTHVLARFRAERRKRQGTATKGHVLPRTAQAP